MTTRAPAASIASLLASIKAQATDYVGNDPVRAANLAILAVAVGEDPASFGGLNLLPLIAAGTKSSNSIQEVAASNTSGAVRRQCRIFE